MANRKIVDHGPSATAGLRVVLVAVTLEIIHILCSLGQSESAKVYIRFNNCLRSPERA